MSPVEQQLHTTVTTQRAGRVTNEVLLEVEGLTNERAGLIGGDLRS